MTEEDLKQFLNLTSKYLGEKEAEVLSEALKRSVDNIFTHLKYLHLLSPPYLTNTPGSKGCYR